MGRPPFFSLTLKTFVFIKIHLLSSLLLNKASMFKWLLWIYTTEHLNLFICTLQILKFPVFPFLCIWITGWAWESSTVVKAQTQPWVLLGFFFKPGHCLAPSKFTYFTIFFFCWISCVFIWCSFKLLSSCNDYARTLFYLLKYFSPGWTYCFPLLLPMSKDSTY